MYRAYIFLKLVCPIINPKCMYKNKCLISPSEKGLKNVQALFGCIIPSEHVE